jgi:hypothetical protein
VIFACPGSCWEGRQGKGSGAHSLQNPHTSHSRLSLLDAGEPPWQLFQASDPARAEALSIERLARDAREGAISR